LEIPRRRVDDIVILQPAGRMTIGEADYALRQAVADAVESGATKLLLNLGSVSYMDSAALGELLSSRQLLAEKGGQVRLCALQSRVRTVVEITGLSAVLDVHETEAEALAAFGQV
jgi:anti-anti-sigma factor